LTESNEKAALKRKAIQSLTKS